jgi:hypothetical protein
MACDTNVTRADAQEAMREHGCILELVKLTLVGHRRPIARFATSCLMALCYQNPLNREVVREVGGIPPLLDLLTITPPHPITEKAAWCLSNLCAHCSANQVLSLTNPI